MDTVSLNQIAAWSGAVSWAGVEGTASRITTDSRVAGAGDVFVALKGERFDGHHFVEEVASKGAVAAVVEDGWCPREGESRMGCRLIRVRDTLEGLQRLAAGFRESLPVRVVGITGSSGKTSTKDFTFAALSSRLKGWCTQGNLNNHIGVPLSLLCGSKEAQMAVIEMGMNHAGEIAPLARMAKPDLAIITNIGVAHIEHLGSREAIAREKAALAQAVPASGTVILHSKDDFTDLISELSVARVFTVGFEHGDLQVVDFAAVPGGSRFGLIHEGYRVEVDLPVPGVHMAQNAAMAAAAAVAMDLPLEVAAEGLRTIELGKGRMQARKIHGIDFLDDTYNANPDSMCAALRTLAQWPTQGSRIAVLGRMGELGTHAEEGHRRVGRVAAEGVNWLIAVGVEGEWIAEEARREGAERVDHFAELSDAVSALRANMREGDVVLVKGSRSARMERVLEEVERV
jgi:UDP-N-acetylmuramoyl-tripeptide--D-alanyl-D-alanine ligase